MLVVNPFEQILYGRSPPRASPGCRDRTQVQLLGDRTQRCRAGCSDFVDHRFNSLCEFVCLVAAACNRTYPLGRAFSTSRKLFPQRLFDISLAAANNMMIHLTTAPCVRACSTAIVRVEQFQTECQTPSVQALDSERPIASTR